MPTFTTPFNQQQPTNNPIPTDLQQALEAYKQQISQPRINPGSFHPPSDFHLSMYKNPLKRNYGYTQLATDVNMPETNPDPTFQNTAPGIANTANHPQEMGQSTQPNHVEQFIKAALNQGHHPQDVMNFVRQKVGLHKNFKK